MVFHAGPLRKVPTRWGQIRHFQTRSAGKWLINFNWTMWITLVKLIRFCRTPWVWGYYTFSVAARNAAGRDLPVDVSHVSHCLGIVHIPLLMMMMIGFTSLLHGQIILTLPFRQPFRHPFFHQGKVLRAWVNASCRPPCPVLWDSRESPAERFGVGTFSERHFSKFQIQV